jgi:hypothetical protein
MSSVKARRKRAAPVAGDADDDYPFGFVLDTLDGLFQVSAQPSLSTSAVRVIDCITNLCCWLHDFGT